MKSSQLRGWMRRYGNGGGSDSRPGVRTYQSLGSILVFALLALSAGGMWWLRPTPRRVKAVVVTAPLPVVKPIPAPLRPQWQPRLAAERHRLDLAEGPIFRFQVIAAFQQTEAY